MEYEYKTEMVTKQKEIAGVLNHETECGWEFVTMAINGGVYTSFYIMIFKRKK